MAARKHQRQIVDLTRIVFRAVGVVSLKLVRCRTLPLCDAEIAAYI